jgi:hypothetical protein
MRVLPSVGVRTGGTLSGLGRAGQLAIASSPPRERASHPYGKAEEMLAGLIGLLIVVAIVLFLAKVAIAGGIVGVIALVVLIWFLMNR